jgi:hypothetical protein
VPLLPRGRRAAPDPALRGRGDESAVKGEVRPEGGRSREGALPHPAALRDRGLRMRPPAGPRLCRPCEHPRRPSIAARRLWHTVDPCRASCRPGSKRQAVTSNSLMAPRRAAAAGGVGRISAAGEGGGGSCATG